MKWNNFSRVCGQQHGCIVYRFKVSISVVYMQSTQHYYTAVLVCALTSTGQPWAPWLVRDGTQRV
jgi:hypothetical protein